jgi:hypothetical protein
MQLSPKLALAALLAFGCLVLPAHVARGDVLISEFMASNAQTLDDEDGDASDWIELLNTGSAPVNLAGWSLTDKASNPRQWIFPSVTIAAGGRLLVFASEKNRRDPAGELHTNFKLSGDGEYLGLFKPDSSVSHAYAPKFPAQIQDVSYGVAQGTVSVALSAETAVARYKLPADGSLGLSWTAPDFDDTTWSSAAQGLGFETLASEFAPYLSAGGNLLGSMYGQRSSLFVRIPFTVETPADISGLLLKLRYDDGFVAWINGVPVAENLAPDVDPMPWNAAATGERPDAQCIIWEEHPFPAQSVNLRAGTNILAVQLLNKSAGNADALLQTTLLGQTSTVSPANVVYFQQPTPGEVNNAGAANPGPVIREVTETVARPAPGLALSIPITARVSPSFHPVATVQLKYRVMYNAEVTATMHDDGLGGDTTAGDGIYTALMTPTLPAGNMLRWRVVATDAESATATLPAFADPLDSPQYFGTVATDSSYAESRVPVFEWFVPPGGDPDSEAGARISVYYLGEFYDNIESRVRGRSSRSFPKKGENLDFNHNARFRWKDGERRVKDIDLITNWADKAHVRLALAFEMCRLAGLPAHFDFHVRVQRNAAFHGLYDMIEDGDDRYLDRVGLDPEGALYKFYAYNHLRAPVAGYTKKTRKDEADTDLQDLVANIAESRPLADRRRYAYDFLDLPAMINYHAVCAIIGHRDQGGKNFYIYRDTNRTQQWQFLPWDLDLTFGHTYTYAGTTSWNATYTGQGYYDDDIDSQQILRTGWDNPIKQILWNVPELNEMFVRRVKTLADQYLGSPAAPASYVPQRVAALLDLLDPPGLTGLTDAELDFRKWGFWVDGSGSVLPYTNAAAALHRIRPQAARMLDTNPHPAYPGVAEYTRFYPVDNVPLPVRNLDSQPAWLTGRRSFLYTPGAALSGMLGLPAAQVPTVDTLQIDAVDVNPGTQGQDAEYIAIRNTGAQAVDLSGWKLAGAVDYVFPGGCVLPAASANSAGMLYVAKEITAFRNRTSGPHGNESRLVVGGYSGRLSARGETLELRRADDSLALSYTTPAQPTPLQQGLRISALLYAPAPPTAGEAQQVPNVLPEDFEWVELLNIGATTLDLSGARFAAGIDFVFPPGTSLAPGQRTLVVGNLAAFRARYQGGPTVAGEFAGNLDNDGEELQLEDATGETVLEFTYAGKWSPAADSLGHALIVKAPVTTPWSSWELPATWAPSLTPGGSPGQPSSTGVSFLAWQTEHFSATEAADETIAGPLADPNHNGLVNLVEYLTGRSPSQSNPSLLTGLTRVGNTLQVDCPRNALAVDGFLSFEKQSSLTDGAWEAATPVSTQTIPGGAVRLTFAVSGNQTFLRLKATMP